MPSRHRSENKQRRTAGDGAAFMGRRKNSVGEKTIRRQSIKTRSLGCREELGVVSQQNCGRLHLTSQQQLLHVTEQQNRVFLAGR